MPRSSGPAATRVILLAVATLLLLAGYPGSASSAAARAVPARAVATPVTGHARLAGDDYPYATLGQFEQMGPTDPWNEFYGQCDSFAAWKVYENLGGLTRANPDRIPVSGFTPPDANRSPVWGTARPTGRSNWGDARDWGRVAPGYGYAVDGTPRPGSIAWWSDQGTGMALGHVGYVADVYPDGTILVESYNLRENGQYSTVHLGPGGTDDRSFHLPAFHVVWPTGFIHIGDGAFQTVQPPAPVPAVAFHYPRNVYGPGDGSGFSLAGAAYPGSDHGWYTHAGHGEIGQMKWTNTHAGAADSTATWSPPLRAGACYAVDALIPDSYSNAPAATYLVSGAAGTTTARVDQNAFTDQWARVGVYQAGPDGRLSVTLTDQSPAGSYVAADAMRFVLQTACPS
ncbi:hypothetical protein GCM10009530_43040 [Microbispora corallina]|uniref:Peptidase C51 domain-containing protein n=1 Tax=Microbispora corallina TaxID=83302 RepID=A0ABQ4G126_9ACTN|nr:CHAP domain-containing protein [Microbispora corallina]GIH40767.1 hypothetical protein Mco01_37670 [Microbispora corallina]